MANPAPDPTQQHLQEFGDRVRLLRLAQRLSQEQLAERAGLHRNFIGNIERGERNIRLGTLFILAEALGVEPAELFS